MITNLVTAGFTDTTAVSGQTNYHELVSEDGCGDSSNSAAVSVFLPLPTLGMNASGNSLTITWPEWASDWTLYSATNLTLPVVWSPVTNEAGSNNGFFGVNLPISLKEQFFCLTSQ